MKFIAAALALALAGCVIRFPANTPDARTVVVCVLASCRDVCQPQEKQKTPTPSSSHRKVESPLNPQASRLDPQRAEEGDRPYLP